MGRRDATTDEFHAHAAEALLWLTSCPTDKYRNIGEMDHDASLRLVKQLYLWGAAEVLALDISANNKTYESAAGLSIRLPKLRTARGQIFEWAGRQKHRAGFDPDEDEGQAHLILEKLKRWDP